MESAESYFLEHRSNFRKILLDLPSDFERMVEKAGVQERLSER